MTVYLLHQDFACQQIAMIALYDSIVNNDLSKLKVLVERYKLDLNTAFTEVRKKLYLGSSPIHLVCYLGLTDMLQYLYDQKCDVNLTSGKLRRTAFHTAVQGHNVDCLHMLLSFGATADARDVFGNSPCHYAAEDGVCEILKILLKQPVEVDAQDITLTTPLMKATRNGKLKAVECLIAAGCSLNIQDKNGDVALHFATRLGSEELVRVLIDAGSDLDTPNKWGRTALMEAVSHNHTSVSATMIKAGCDINTPEIARGDTPLHVATRKSYNHVFELLLATGKVTHLYNHSGELPLYDAVLNNKMDLIKRYLYHNYDMDVVIKLDQCGTGTKSVVDVAMDKGHIEVLTLMARIGFIWNTFGSVVEAKKEYVPSGVEGQISYIQPHGTSPAELPVTIVKAERTTELQQFFSELDQVCTLKASCLKVIRRRVGIGIHKKIMFLSIPKPLQEYLLLLDIL